MAFRFFENAINSNAQQQPNDMYRDLEQEFVNIQFDNTSAKIIVQEQDGIGINKYHDIEVWIDSTVADTTTGLKDSNDFNKLFFKDINHEIVRGLMYKFDNNYWIVNNYSKFSGLAQQCGIRRCNNRLKIIDPLNGQLQVVPCCVDYDMTSPSVQTSRYIITPNNHATVIVQGNDLTLRLFKTNTRYVLSGRPFKLLAYQNAVEYSEEEQQTTLLYLDLYLDEIHDGDDLINGIADNGNYNYSIKINADDMTLSVGASGQLKADITLNGKEVQRNIVWESSNKNAVVIDENGFYNIVGQNGDEVIISAYIDGNTLVRSDVMITVSDAENIMPNVVIDPIFDKIRQYDTINFVTKVEYNGETYSEFNLNEVELIDANGCAELRHNLDDSYSIVGLNISKEPFGLSVHIENVEPAFDITKIFNIQVVSMMG